VGGVVRGATGKWVPDFFDEYLARPLQFHSYHLNLMPTGEAYMGGGAYLRPRDELKLGQLYLGGGLWNGRRVVSQEWVEESTAPHSSFTPAFEAEGEHQYGYGWHIHRLKIGDRIYRDYGAGGNGGQVVIVIPELDLVVGFNGGSYGEFPKWYRWELELVPQYIIPAVISAPSH
jgi:CubicO group peptidase (beta-lactamase class C family)